MALTRLNTSPYRYVSITIHIAKVCGTSSRILPSINPEHAEHLLNLIEACYRYGTRILRRSIYTFLGHNLLEFFMPLVRAFPTEVYRISQNVAFTLPS